MGVDQARDGDLAGLELEALGMGIGSRLEVDRGTGERDLAGRDPDRLDPAEPGVAGERGDPACDERVEWHQPPPSSQPSGSATRAASASRSRPAPSPTASATRAFGPPRWPASSAPARTHVAPAPWNAYAPDAAPAGQRVVRTTTDPWAIDRVAAS